MLSIRYDNFITYDPVQLIQYYALIKYHNWTFRLHQFTCKYIIGIFGTLIGSIFAVKRMSTLHSKRLHDIVVYTTIS